MSRIWSFEEARRKVQKDLDLEEELFISPSEMMGLWNEAIDQAEALIMKINEDYFLTMAPLRLVAGRSVYAPPENIYAMKIRSIDYQNGSYYYSVPRLRNHRKFQDIDRLNFSPPNSNEYIWYIRNDSADGFKIVFTNAPQESTGTSVSISLANPGLFTTTADHGLAVGDEIHLSTTDELPTGFEEGMYIVSTAPSSTTFTLAKVPGGAAVQASGTQGGTHYFQKSPFKMTVWFIRTARRITDDADPIDIPQFVNYLLQYVKVRVYEKEGHPNMEKAQADLDKQEQMMVDTLTEMVPDNQDTIPLDTSHYEEHI